MKNTKKYTLSTKYNQMIAQICVCVQDVSLEHFFNINKYYVDCSTSFAMVSSSMSTKLAVIDFSIILSLLFILTGLPFKSTVVAEI